MEYLNKKGKLKESEACKFFHQIIAGLDYLHQCGIAHRDFKPENILLTNDNQILKIIDFGLSNTYKKGQLLKTGCGSPCYVPPEMINEIGYNGALTDIWSAGVILYLMLCGNLPFFHDDNQILYEKILSGKYETPSHLSEDAKDILSKLLEVDPKKRINFEGIKSHPWFSLIDKNYMMNKGIIVTEDIFPIDEDIIQKMEKMGFNKMETRYNILKNYHNKITTIYDLLRKRKTDLGQKSVSDMNSDLFNNYINDPKNKISNYGNINEVLKKRIGDDQKPVSSVPNWPENKYEDDCDKMIIGDSGSVIERLIKSGRFTYDEENMTLNRVTNKPAIRKQIINDEDRYKTVSSMQPGIKKFKKTTDYDDDNTHEYVKKRSKVHFQEEQKSRNKKNNDNNWYKEMEESIEKELLDNKNKTSAANKAKKKISQTIDNGNSDVEDKKSLKNLKKEKRFQSSKNFKVVGNDKKKLPSKISGNPNAKSMKALKKNLRSTISYNENNMINNKNQTSKPKKTSQLIKNTDDNRPKTGKRKENSVDKNKKRGGKFKKIGDIEELNERGNTRRNQSAQKRLNKIKI